MDKMNTKHYDIIEYKYNQKIKALYQAEPSVETLTEFINEMTDEGHCKEALCFISDYCCVHHLFGALRNILKVTFKKYYSAIVAAVGEDMFVYQTAEDDQGTTYRIKAISYIHDVLPDILINQICPKEGGNNTYNFSPNILAAFNATIEKRIEDMPPYPRKHSKKDLLQAAQEIPAILLNDMRLNTFLERIDDSILYRDDQPCKLERQELIKLVLDEAILQLQIEETFYG
jgi:hypothetical protein